MYTFLASRAKLSRNETPATGFVCGSIPELCIHLAADCCQEVVIRQIEHLSVSTCLFNLLLLMNSTFYCVCWIEQSGQTFQDIQVAINLCRFTVTLSNLLLRLRRLFYIHTQLKAVTWNQYSLNFEIYNEFIRLTTMYDVLI